MNILQEFIAALQKPEMTIRSGDNRKGSALPPGWTQEYDSDKYQEVPTYLQQASTFETMADFIGYLGFHADNKDSTIWAESGNNPVILAIIDAHQKNLPSFERHKALLPLTRSVEWVAWSNISGKWLQAGEFTEFLEDNLEFITGDFSGAKVLEMCRDLSIKTDGETKVRADVAEGRRSLSITQNSEVKGKDVAFPEFLTASLRVFKDYSPSEFEVRLRVNSDNGVKFQIKLADKDLVEEKAFDAVLEKLRTDLVAAELDGLTVFRGATGK